RKPWVIRTHQLLLDGLASQGFNEEIWTIFDYHLKNPSEYSDFMCAVSLNALRSLPKMSQHDWERLTAQVFDAPDVTRLMATQTWIHCAAQLETPPFPDSVRKGLMRELKNGQPNTRRLYKNYLLMAGLLDPAIVDDLQLELSD